MIYLCTHRVTAICVIALWYANIHVSIYSYQFYITDQRHGLIPKHARFQQQSDWIQSDCDWKILLITISESDDILRFCNPNWIQLGFRQLQSDWIQHTHVENLNMSSLYDISIYTYLYTYNISIYTYHIYILRSIRLNTDQHVIAIWYNHVHISPPIPHNRSATRFRMID